MLRVETTARIAARFELSLPHDRHRCIVRQESRDGKIRVKGLSPRQSEKHLLELTGENEADLSERRRLLDRLERGLDPKVLSKERPYHVSCQGKKLVVEAPGGRARPVVFKGEEEQQEPAKEPKIEVWKGQAVLAFTDQPASCCSEPVIEEDPYHHPNGLFEESNFCGDVVILGQGIIVQK